MRNHLGKIVDKVQGYTIIDCKKCEFKHVFPFPPEEKLQKLYREDFYISNICKCYPKITRTPTGEHIDKCNFWLDKEIDQVKPSLILAFGNTGLKGFQSKYKKITDANEKVEINHAYNTEICWCIHPSAVLHNPSNKDLFERGIQKFTERYLKLNQEK